MSLPRGIEEWRVVEDFEEYEVSSFGRVRSNRSTNSKILTGTITKFGYVAVILRKSGNSHPHRRLVHRLVALAFLPKPPNLYTEVAHNNGNPGDNHVSNLRWALHSENQLDMRKHGTMQDGERCVTAKITEEQAREIARRAKIRGQGRKLSQEFGLSPAQISRIKNGQRWNGALNLGAV